MSSAKDAKLKEYIEKLKNVLKELHNDTMSSSDLQTYYNLTKAKNIEELSDFIITLASKIETEQKKLKLTISEMTWCIIDIQQEYIYILYDKNKIDTKRKWYQFFTDSPFKITFSVVLGALLLIGGLMIFYHLDEKAMIQSTKAVKDITSSVKGTK